jgi:glycine/D-amino acid oxidase-like deaminating enzyme
VSLTELRAVRGKLGLPVERDEHFDADKTLSAYADAARQHGGIVT